MNNKPIILLPGMAADASIFDRLRPKLPGLVTPEWVAPRGKESLPEYAERLAKTVDAKEPCYIGGVSFGGMVALEMARYLDVKACFLIASVRSRNELPWQFQCMRPLARLGPRRFRGIAATAHRFKPYLPARTGRRLDRLCGPRAEFFCWASWAVLNWRPSPTIRDLCIHQIHGADDRTLPSRSTRPDVVIPGAGHALPLTHPREIHEFIMSHIEGAGSAD